MIQFQAAKLGTAKGIPSLVIAAASIDNVFAITGFSVCFTIALAACNSTQTSDSWNIVMSILQGPIQATIGVVYGLVGGFLLWYIPQRCTRSTTINSTNFDLHRFTLLLLAGTFALFGSERLNLGGTGPLAILVLAFVACLRWRPLGLDAFNEAALKRLWIVLEHYLFVLIAADVRVKSLESNILLYGVLCLLLALVWRMIAAFAVTYGQGMNWRERAFIAIAWVPKASVQAAIGPLALEAAATGENVKRGRLVLTLAVLSILLTAPLGAIAVDCSARWMLRPDEKKMGRESRSSSPDERTTLLVY